MVGFNVSFWVDDYVTHEVFWYYTKEQAIRHIKDTANCIKARYFSIEYKDSGKSVGSWEKRGSRWYKM